MQLRASAEYLDSVWVRCRLSRTMGTSASVLGGGLTIAGGVLTTLTAGLAAPVLIGMESHPCQLLLDHLTGSQLYNHNTDPGMRFNR